MDDLWERPGPGWERFFVDTPFVRKDAEGGEKGELELLGYASTWVKDRDDEYVDPRAFDDTLEPYLRKNPIMLWQHERQQPIGNVRHAQVDHSGLGVKGWQPPPAEKEPDWKHLAYHSVKSGIVRTFSIGGYFERAVRENRNVIDKVHLMEISVVSIPSNPESLFEAAAKALGQASSRPDLTQKHVQQMLQVLGARPITDPELVLMNDAERRARYEELARHYRKTGRRAPEYEEWHELSKEVFGQSGRAAVGGAKRVIAFMQRAQGYVPEGKRGRTISAKNEEKLKRAADLINDVVAQVSSDEGQEGPEGEEQQ